MTARDIRAGKGYVELGVKDYLEKGLKRSLAKLKAFGQSMTNIGAKIAAVGTAGATAFIQPIMAASKLEETMNKFDVVFGNNSQAMQEWGDDLGKTIGRGRTEVRGFLADTQDLLVPMGFEPGAAEEMSKQITTLGFDLASFNNKADGDVIRDLHSALTGSSEVMLKYGVIVNEAAVKQELLNNGIDPKYADNQSKALARMSIIMRGTTAAQGDAVRSAGSFANQIKALKASFQNASEEIGKAVLPAVTEFVAKTTNAVKIVGEWAGRNPKLIATVAAVTVGVAALGGALFVAGGAASAIATIFGVIATAGTVLASVLGAIFSPLGLIVGLIGAGVWLAFKDTIIGLGTNFSILGDKWQDFVDLIKAGDFESAFRLMSRVVKAIFDGLWNDIKVGFKVASIRAKRFAAVVPSVKKALDQQIETTIKGGEIHKKWLMANAHAEIESIKEAAKAKTEAKAEVAEEGLSGHERAQKYLDEEKVAKVDKTIKAVAGDPGAFTRSSVEGQRKAFENAMKQLMPKEEDKVAKKLDEQKVIQKKMLQQLKNIQPVAVVG